MRMVRQLAASVAAAAMAVGGVHGMTMAVDPTGTPAPAPTGSLAYIANSNVWLAAPDGSGAHALTTDGTDDVPYRSPAQAPDGTVFVLHGPSEVDHLGRDGSSAGAPVTLNVLENGAEALAVSPDGTRLTYVTTGYGTYVDPRFGTPAGTYIYGGTDVATLDGTSVPGAAIAGFIFPSWRDAKHLVGTDGVSLYQDTIGVEESVWLSLSDGCIAESLCDPGQAPAASLSDLARSADDRVVAYSYKPYFGTAGRRMASVDAMPSLPPVTRCLIPDQQDFSDPGSFSPDASWFAYDDTRFDPNTFETIVGEGVWLVPLDLDETDCGESAARLVVPGGSQPDWGPMAP